MITVKNYIKRDEEFIPVDDFNESIPDPEYIDSAMELTINGSSIITLAEWDYMVPLWAYIANGFEELAEHSERQEWTTGFPDQPIDLIFRLDRKNKKIEVESNPSRGKIKATANLDEFIDAISEAGHKFFLRMAEIVPKERTYYENDAKRMYEVAEKLRRSITK